MNKKKKIILASILGINTSVLASGNLLNNNLAKDDEFLSHRPHEKSNFSAIYRR